MMINLILQVEIDFEYMLPNAYSLFSSFGDFSEKILPIFEEKIKDQNCREILSALQNKENITESKFNINLLCIEDIII